MRTFVCCVHDDDDSNEKVKGSTVSGSSESNNFSKSENNAHLENAFV
jgi:hypothetical protein